MTVSRRYKKVLVGGIVGAVIVVILIGGLAVWMRQRPADDTDNVQAVVHKVAKHMLLPSDETPGLVTVVDKTRVKNIPFIERAAENGDKMLVYAKARKAILYRPSIDRIVDMGPVSIADLSQPAQ